MALERKDNDDQMEKLRMEADDVAAKVRISLASCEETDFWPDVGTSEEERSRT
jgi:hypothetical protein